MPVQYAIEKSNDGRNFTAIAMVNGYNNNAETNYYSWSGPSQQSENSFYRIRLISGSQQKFSRIVKLSTNERNLQMKVANPFYNKLAVEITTSQSQLVYLQLIDNSGKIICRQPFALVNGTNNLQLENSGSLANGLYTLQLLSDAITISRKVLKQ